ncbi:hypothetical protein E3P77_00197 [Wallemia ichthyophaga]|nr:hypothetical protein E3P77_00197 [Wallemia ichthyophaga]
MFDESAFDVDDGTGYSPAPSPSMSAVSAVPSLFYGTSSPSSSLCPSPSVLPSNLTSPAIPSISLPPTSSTGSSKALNDEIRFTRKPSVQNAPMPTTFSTATPYQSYQSRRRSYPVIRQSQFSGGGCGGFVSSSSGTYKPTDHPAERGDVAGTIHPPHSHSSAIDNLKKQNHRHTNPSTSPVSMSMSLSLSTSQTPISSFLNGCFGDGSPTQSSTNHQTHNRTRSKSHGNSQAMYSSGRVGNVRGNRWHRDDGQSEQATDTDLTDRRGRSATRSSSRDVHSDSRRLSRLSPNPTRSARSKSKSKSKSKSSHSSRSSQSCIRTLPPLKQEQSDDTIGPGCEEWADWSWDQHHTNKLAISTQHHRSDRHRDSLEHDYFDLEATPKLEKKQVIGMGE